LPLTEPVRGAVVGAGIDAGTILVDGGTTDFTFEEVWQTG
jgi:hypothetical protein